MNRLLIRKFGQKPRFVHFDIADDQPLVKIPVGTKSHDVISEARKEVARQHAIVEVLEAGERRLGHRFDAAAYRQMLRHAPLETIEKMRQGFAVDDEPEDE
jgi:hypothetical protein